MKTSRLFAIGLYAVLGVAFTAAPRSSMAQANRSTITGTVTDASGAVVPNVELTATNNETKVSSSTVANDQGIYSVLNLPPGTYTLSAKREGFKTVDYTNVTLVVDQVVQLNVALNVGATAEQVTVTTDAPTLDRETSTIGTNMVGDVVTDLPLNVYGGRQAENFAVALTPGYSPLSNPYTAVINGTQTFTKEIYRLAALPVRQTCKETPSSHLLAWKPSRKFKPRLSGLSARNASTNGGVMMYNLKSGTQPVSRQRLGYGQANELLDANTFDNNHLKSLCLTGDPDAAPPCGRYNKGEARFWDWGFSFGGPIIKNKTFSSPLLSVSSKTISRRAHSDQQRPFLRLTFFPEISVPFSTHRCNSTLIYTAILSIKEPLQSSRSRCCLRRKHHPLIDD